MQAQKKRSLAPRCRTSNGSFSERIAVLLKGLRVLITEDDSDSRELLCLYLTLQKFEVVPADNGEDTLRIAREGKFDAYLMDNRLPDISGLELCERIRAFDSDTPIVFYSGDENQSHKDKAFLAGAQDYIVKPASCEDVLNSLLAAVKGKAK
jgi:two-component system, OmpR family, response regulator